MKFCTTFLTANKQIFFSSSHPLKTGGIRALLNQQMTKENFYSWISFYCSVPFFLKQVLFRKAESIGTGLIQLYLLENSNGN